MATTYDFAAGTTIVGVNPPITPTPNENTFFILRNIIDCSKQTLGAGTTDIAQILDIPAGTTIVSCYVRIITAETAAATFTLGYSGAANVWGNALAADTAAGGILGATHDWVPVHFASADTVDIVISGAVDFDAFKFEVVAVCLKALDTY